MGICISKCCSHPTNKDINLPQPQDKQVISQHNHHPPTKPETTSSSPSNSASSSSITSTSASSSCKPTSKLKPYTNEFLLACAKENPHIVILDPRKHGSVTNRKTPRDDQPTKQKSIKLASKRERSSSPQRPIAKAKCLRRDRIMMTDKYKSDKLCSFDAAMKHRRGIGAKGDGKVRSLSPCKSVCKRNAKDRSGDSVMEDIDNPLISMECFIFL